MVITQEEKITEIRKSLSIELCDNFIKRLHPEQKKEIKIGAIIAIKNLIKESKIDDPILINCLVDTITDQDKEVRKWVIRTIKEVPNPLITELLQTKLLEKEIRKEIKNDIKTALKI